MPPRLPNQLPQGPVAQSREQTQRLFSELGSPEALRPSEFCHDATGDLWWRSPNGRLYKLTGTPLPADAYEIAVALGALRGVSLGGGTGAGATGPTGATGSFPLLQFTWVGPLPLDEVIALYVSPQAESLVSVALRLHTVSDPAALVRLLIAHNADTLAEIELSTEILEASWTPGAPLALETGDTITVARVDAGEDYRRAAADLTVCMEVR